MPTLHVVVPTKDRPWQLRECLRTLIARLCCCKSCHGSIMCACTLDGPRLDTGEAARSFVHETRAAKASDEDDEVRVEITVIQAPASNASVDRAYTLAYSQVCASGLAHACDGLRSSMSATGIPAVDSIDHGAAYQLWHVPECARGRIRVCVMREDAHRASAEADCVSTHTRVCACQHSKHHFTASVCDAHALGPGAASPFASCLSAAVCAHACECSALLFCVDDVLWTSTGARVCAASLAGVLSPARPRTSASDDASQRTEAHPGTHTHMIRGVHFRLHASVDMSFTRGEMQRPPRMLVLRGPVHASRVQSESGALEARETDTAAASTSLALSGDTRLAPRSEAMLVWDARQGGIGSEWSLAGDLSAAAYDAAFAWTCIRSLCPCAYATVNGFEVALSSLLLHKSTACRTCGHKWSLQAHAAGQHETQTAHWIGCPVRPTACVTAINRVQDEFDNRLFTTAARDGQFMLPEEFAVAVLDRDADARGASGATLSTEALVSAFISMPRVHVSERGISPAAAPHVPLLPWRAADETVTTGVLVSVLMPVYRPSQRYLTQALHSIAIQTHSVWELVLVDDGNDASGKEVIAQSIRDAGLQHDLRMRVINLPRNVGVACALNAGLQACRGEFIARMDADDVALPARLASQLLYLREHPSVIAVGSAVEIIGDACEPMCHHAHKILRPPLHPAIVAWSMHFACPVVHPSVMLRRTAFVENSVFAGYPTDEGVSITEDYALWTKLSVAHGCGAVANLGEPLLQLRKHSSNVSSEHGSLQRRQTCHVARSYILRKLAGTGLSAISVDDVAPLVTGCSDAFESTASNLLAAAELVDRLAEMMTVAPSSHDHRYQDDERVAQRAIARFIREDAKDKLLDLYGRASHHDAAPVCARIMQLVLKYSAPTAKSAQPRASNAAALITAFLK